MKQDNCSQTRLNETIKELQEGKKNLMLIMFLYFLHLQHYKNVKHCLKGACSLLLCLFKLQKYNFILWSVLIYTLT